MFALLLATALVFASPTAPPGPELTFVHGDEHLATWLERASVQRQGDVVRYRLLRVRGTDQAFWLVRETDCASSTQALVRGKNVWMDGPEAPPMEGEARHFPIRPYERMDRAVAAVVCQGAATAYPWARPVRGVEAAVAAAPQVRARAVAQRPLELVQVKAGRFPLFLDRSTLDGGGPQWEGRTLQLTRPDDADVAGVVGAWSWWEWDCQGYGRDVDLKRYVQLMSDGSSGPETVDRAPYVAAQPGSDEAAALQAVCAADIWTRPALGSLEEARRALGAAPVKPAE